MAIESKVQVSIISNAVDLQRLSAYEEGKAIKILTDLQRDLRYLLITGDLNGANRREIRRIIAIAEEMINGRYAQVAGGLDFAGLLGAVSESTVNAMLNIIPNAKPLTLGQLAAMANDVLIGGSPAAAWWRKQASNLAFQFAAIIRRGLLIGQTIDQMVRDVDGVMDVSRRHARKLVHSTVMTSANHARLETYRAHSEAIRGVRWLATLDSRTCRQCAALDGQAWDLDGNRIDGTEVSFIGAPPAHFNCRCVLTPIPESLDTILGLQGLDDKLAQASRRASADGPVNTLTFAEWLKTQPREVIEEQLGKGRAELWLAGKITLTDLLSGQGRELTLNELREKLKV